MRSSRYIMNCALALAASVFFPVSAGSQEAAGMQDMQTTITLDVRDMEIADVIRLIADQSDLNIIVSRNVRGTVTTSLQDVSVQQALESILEVNNLGYRREGSIIQVYTLPELNQREQFEPLVTKIFKPVNVRVSDLRQTLLSLKSPRGRIEIEPRTNSILVVDTEGALRDIESTVSSMDTQMTTRVYRLSYAVPADIAKSLASVVPATDGDVIVDARTNSIVVNASPVVLNTVDELIKRWDRRIPQVQIEARIMQITLGKSDQFGVDWQITSPERHSLSVGARNLPVSTAAAATVNFFRIGVLNDDNYELIINALGRSNDAKLVSNPRVLALDNHEARILIGSSEPYEVFHYDVDGNITSREIKFIEVGIKLTVTPKISEDGFITMDIRPEVSSPRVGTATNALAIDTTEATTRLTVKDGQTVVLGGLINDDKQEHIAKIPVLGDIPVIKYLFRTTYHSDQKREIIIFITPTIVSAEAGAAEGKNG